MNPKEVGIKPQHTVSPRTITALKNRGLLHMRTNQKGRALWRPTDVGRGVVSEHVPQFLHKHSHRSGETLTEGDGKSSGYTHRSWEAMWGEPEAMPAPKARKNPVVKDTKLEDALRLARAVQVSPPAPRAA